jgi:diaminopimelate epimerase
MTGAGNDFVLIDNRKRDLQVDWSKSAPRLCDRHYGVGADGLLIIDKHPHADFAMYYYNADGSSGGMCGNGGRCAAAFVMDIDSLTRVSFYTLDYLYDATFVSESNIQLRMKDPGPILTNILIEFRNEVIQVHFVDTGTQHTVIFLDELSPQLQAHIQSSGIHEIAKCVRFSDRFAPEGTNVNFVRLLDNQMLEMRTYEKGVEDETLACGTGAIASAILTAVMKNMLSPIGVKTKSNERLVVSFEREDGHFRNVTLEGPARIVFKGQYILNTQ